VDAYTKLNLRTDVEDHAPKFGFDPDMEYRTAGPELEAGESAISFLRLAPEFRLPFGHSHKQQEEIYVLVSGSARLKLDDEVVELEPWDAVRIAKETVRNLEAGSDGAELILIGAPATGPGDAETIQDWWSKDRANAGASLG
jgi:mannose-6-phosphate isomerase-like protein (cupin superfamily)